MINLQHALVVVVGPVLVDVHKSTLCLFTKGGMEEIRSAHGIFYDVGSDVVTTVTYQCSHYFRSTDSHAGGGGRKEKDAIDSTIGSHRGFEEEIIDGVLRSGA